MAVVINEFEVVAEAPGAGPAGASATTSNSLITTAISAHASRPISQSDRCLDGNPWGRNRDPDVHVDKLSRRQEPGILNAVGAGDRLPVAADAQAGRQVLQRRPRRCLRQ